MFTDQEQLFITTLVDWRLEEIERLAAEHPNLPMKDPATIAIYESIKRKCDPTR